MSTFSMTNATIWIAGFDFSSQSNKLSLKASAQELDTTTFGQTYVNRIGGLRSVQMGMEGFWTSLPDAAQFAQLGTPNQAVTVSGAGLEQTVGYAFLGDQFTYDQFGKVGDAAPFVASLAQNDGVTGLIRGQLAAVNRTVSATGQLGSILTMAGPGATQYVYATLHVLTAATTITVQIQSAPLVNFAAPTTRATIGPITVTGGTFMTRVIGPFTDGFWRMNVPAITGTFVASGFIGIQ